MDYNFNDRLCGATFFAVLLDAAKPQLSSKEKWQGNSNGITQPKMFAALIRIANPDITSDFNSDSYEKTFAKYKRCDSSSSPMYFPLTDLTFRNGFDARVKDNYTAAQNDMISFIRTFLDHTDTNKMKKLVGTLQELIAKDDGITHTFYMGTDLAKDVFASITKIELSAYLLAVWHHIVAYITDNKRGADTINNWKSGIDIGYERAKKIAITISEPTETATADETPIDEADADTVVIGKPKTTFPGITQQAGIIVNNFGDGPNITNTGTITINIGGKKD